VIDSVVAAVVGSLSAETRAALRDEFTTGQQDVPRDYDRTLIKTLSEHLDIVEESDKRAMRRKFRDVV